MVVHPAGIQPDPLPPAPPPMTNEIYYIYDSDNKNLLSSIEYNPPSGDISYISANILSSQPYFNIDELSNYGLKPYTNVTFGIYPAYIPPPESALEDDSSVDINFYPILPKITYNYGVTLPPNSQDPFKFFNFNINKFSSDFPITVDESMVMLSAGAAGTYQTGTPIGWKHMGNRIYAYENVILPKKEWVSGHLIDKIIDLEVDGFFNSTNGLLVPGISGIFNIDGTACSPALLPSANIRQISGDILINSNNNYYINYISGFMYHDYYNIPYIVNKDFNDVKYYDNTDHIWNPIPSKTILVR